MGFAIWDIRHMNHMIVKDWTIQETVKMFEWCRENKIPVIERFGSYGSRHYIRAGSGFNDESYWVTNFLVRDRDIALWTLRFGTSVI